jgi:hypothetical protein
MTVVWRIWEILRFKTNAAFGVVIAIVFSFDLVETIATNINLP